MAAGGSFVPAGAADGDSSTMTKKVDSGPFAGLDITVAKTKNLINEVVEVTWKGGRPTEPAVGYQRNFLQLMQCWGDDAAGPTPEQCQWGAVGTVDGNTAIGYAVRTRQVRSPSLPQDPAETHPADGPSGTGFVPFKAVDGRTVKGIYDDFSALFDAQGSNELPVARTRADGTGQEFFEMQTGVEAPGLGCGRLVSAEGEAKRGRSCWLAIVPRSDVEVDGTLRHDDVGTGDEAHRLETSALSASNWANRVLFPLEFQPVGGSCPLGSGQTTILGQENATEAMSRWQQTLCDRTATVFDFNQVPDDAARGNLAGAKPSMGIISKPLESEPAKGAAVYAPISVSGLGFAYILEAQAGVVDPPEAQARSGQRITDLKLTPRLVAKLLTMSYTDGVTTVPEALSHNPRRIEDDPEFQALNPTMQGINKRGNSVVTVISPLNPADATSQVWQWIAGDAEAKAFVDGAPDPSGMIVNPEFKKAELVRNDFPKLDQNCRPPFGTSGPWCVPDAFPYSGDMHEAVRAANKGDSLSRNSWNGFAIPPLYRKGGLEPKGARAIMVVSDSATAARFNLPMASLRNANGKFVTPTPHNLIAAVDAFDESSTPGVLTPNPNVAVDDAYPLTVVSYATVVPAALDDKARASYAGLIEYATGDGQKPGVEPGSLPDGYAPMPERLTKVGKDAAAAIRAYAPATPTPAPTSEPTPAPTQQASSGSNDTSGSTGSSNSSGSTGSTGSSSGSSGSSGSGSTGGTSTGSTSTGSGATASSGTAGAAAGSAQGTTATAAPTAQPPPRPSPAPSVASPASAAGLAKAAIATVTPEVPIGPARYALLWLVLAGTLALGAAQAVPRLPALQAGTDGEAAAGARGPFELHAAGRGQPAKPGR